MKSSKDKILETFRNRLNRLGERRNMLDHEIGEEQTALLLGELQLAQIELEMQNDELLVAAQLLETERAKFAGFFNSAPVGYFILDHLAVINEVNQMGVKLLAYPKDKIIDQRFQSFVSPSYLEHFYTFLHQMQRPGQKNSVEVKLSLSGGEEIYTLLEGTAIINNFTNKVQYYVTVVDMTQEKVSQQKLIETTQRLAMTLSASETGIWTLDLAKRQIFFDSYSLSLLGFRTFDGNVHTFLQHIHPDDRSLVKHAIMENSDELKKIDFEFKVFKEDGSVKYLGAKGQAIENLDGSPYLAGIISDMTKKNQLEQASRNLQQEKQKLILSTALIAQESERQRISSQLHDSICQLLYGIRLNLQHIQNGKNDRKFDSVHQLLAQAIKETRELSYELTPSVLRDFGLRAGIREMVDRLNSSHFKISLQVSESADSLISSVQLTIFRIIQELLNNTIKHAQADKAEIMLLIKDDWITLKVSDNGKGFNAEEEFAYTKGSGLRGIKNRVTLLNGTIDFFTDTHGHTTTIEFQNEM